MTHRTQYTDPPGALVVDADPEAGAALAKSLAQAGYVVERKPLPGAVKLKAPAPRIAFIEIAGDETAKREGFNLAKRLKDLDPSADVVFTADGRDFDVAVKALKLGARDFMKKPFTQAEAGLIVARLVEKAVLAGKVRENEHRQAALLQNIPLLVYAFSPDFSLRFINKAVTAVLGFSPEEALAEPEWLLKRIHPLDRDRARQAMSLAVEEAKPFTLELRLKHKSGREVYGIAKSIPSPENGQRDAETRLIQGVFTDITERVFLESALVQNEKLKTLGAVSAEVAHEIRNPLTAVAGFARRLDKRLPGAPEVGVILREAQRLEKILNRIRDYLKPVRIKREAVGVKALIGEAAALLTPDMESRGVWLKLDFEDQTPPVAADPEMFRQVLVNLLRNAAENAKRDQSIGVKLYTADDIVNIRFTHPLEPGVVIDPDKIFLPFDEGGESVGLPLCARLVESMGGSLSFVQELDLAVFAVNMPTAQGASAAPLQKVRVEKPEPGERCAFDLLSGVMTRSLFDELLIRAIRSAARESRDVSLLLIDLDHFNDYYTKNGDKAADDLLALVGKALGCVLEDDPCRAAARYGSQEFAVVLPGAGFGAAAVTAERCRAAVEALDVANEAAPHGRITASIGGVSLTPSSRTTAADVLAEAGKCLYIAKSRGRNRFHGVDLSTETES